MSRKRFSGSPIDSQQQALSRQEEDVQKQIEDLQRVISEAPQVARQRRERQREALVMRAVTPRSPLDASDRLHVARRDEENLSERPKRQRRAQRRAARVRLLVMLVAVLIAGACVLFLALQLIHHL